MMTRLGKLSQRSNSGTFIFEVNNYFLFASKADSTEENLCQSPNLSGQPWTYVLKATLNGLNSLHTCVHICVSLHMFNNNNKIRRLYEFLREQLEKLERSEGGGKIQIQCM